jgi:hypothetical protein
VRTKWGYWSRWRGRGAGGGPGGPERGGIPSGMRETQGCQRCLISQKCSHAHLLHANLLIHMDVYVHACLNVLKYSWMTPVVGGGGRGTHLRIGSTMSCHVGGLIL